VASPDTVDDEAPPAASAPWRRPRGLLLGTVVAAIAVGAGASWLTTRDDGAPPQVAVEDPGVVHVHGLGINPADGALYAATHTGLFRLDTDGRVQRIADRYQDTMGFTVAGPDRFLASGHPDLRDDELRVDGKPPLLGLIESTDAGRTWQVRSLLGDADLHTIVANGDDLVIAYDSTGGRVVASTDGGRSWDTRGEIGLMDLAVDPADPDRMAAVDLDGAVQTSDDGGRTWTPDTSAPAGLMVLRWGADGLWAGAEDGTLHRWEASGEGWGEVRRFDGAVEAILDHDRGSYVAAEGSGIWMSPDAGRTWRQLYQPEA